VAAEKARAAEDRDELVDIGLGDHAGAIALRTMMALNDAGITQVSGQLLAAAAPTGAQRPKASPMARNTRSPRPCIG
jgi:hypothetical protein